jgi:hypothetical protein
VVEEGESQTAVRGADSESTDGAVGVDDAVAKTVAKAGIRAGGGIISLRTTLREGEGESAETGTGTGVKGLGRRKISSGASAAVTGSIGALSGLSVMGLGGTRSPKAKAKAAAAAAAAAAEEEEVVAVAAAASRVVTIQLQLSDRTSFLEWERAVLAPVCSADGSDGGGDGGAGENNEGEDGDLHSSRMRVCSYPDEDKFWLESGSDTGTGTGFGTDTGVLDQGQGRGQLLSPAGVTTKATPVTTPLLVLPSDGTDDTVSRKGSQTEGTKTTSALASSQKALDMAAAIAAEFAGLGMSDEEDEE